MMFLTILSCCYADFFKKRLVGAHSVDVTLDLQLQRAISGLWLRVDHLGHMGLVLMANDSGYKIITLDCR